MTDRSHRYSSTENRKSWTASRDALEATFGRLWLRLPKRSDAEKDDRQRAVLAEALDVLRSVAAADSDGARQLNRVGFSKADTTLGHRLASVTVDQALSDRALAGKVVRMALRYRRQAFELAQRGLF